MSIIYKKINQIIGPLLFLQNGHDVQYGEIVKIHINNETIRTGQVVKMSEDLIVVEMFEETDGLSSKNSEIIFTGDSFKIKVSEEMLGRTFNSLGMPIDISTKKILKSEVLSEIELDINGTPINPFGREIVVKCRALLITDLGNFRTLLDLHRGQSILTSEYSLSSPI